MTTTAPREAQTPAAGGGNAFPGLIRTLRPRQWGRNGLVLAPRFASVDIFRPHVLITVGIAFVAFSLAASGVYLVNDVKDVEADRAHPTQRNRPIAAGVVETGL